MKQKKYLPFLFAVIFGNVLYFVVFSGKRAPKNPIEKTTLFDEQNNKVDASSFNGKVLILSYFQTWCGDCRKEQPELMELQKHFGEQLKVVMITDESFDKVDSMKAVLSSNLQFYRSEKKLKEIGIRRFPTTYLINKKGEKIEAKVEGIDWYNDKMIKEIDALIAE
jgi:thiol-disulfide isomerase/thioredoxin